MKKRVYLQILLPVLMTLIVLSVTNYFIVLSQKDYQSRVAERLLQYSERVAGQLADAIEVAESSGIAGCTPAGINLLRTIRQKNKYIDDIGIVNGNRILCTAGWGTLRSSILLSSPPYQTPSGYLLYPVRKDNVHLRNPGTVTIKHNIAVVSPALTFANVLNVNPDFYIALAVRNGQKQLFSLGKNYLALQATSGSPFRISTRHCSQIRDLCVTTNKPDGGVMSLSWMLIFLLSLFGIITGCWMVSLIDSALEAKNSLEKRFIRAVKKKDFYIEYQPIVQASDRVVVAYEALVRWQDRYFGRVSPELFIGLASRLKLYQKLSGFVTETALHEMQEHLRRNPSLRLSLNVGDNEMNDCQFLEQLVSGCRRLKIQLQQIKLEITESSRSESGLIAAFCQRAREYGFNISLDDFGTGTANIEWLTVLDFDEIKIDRIFIANIDDPVKRALLVSVVKGLRGTGKPLVFEGVETPAQFKFIRYLDKKALIQGWFTGKPAPIAALNIQV